jgi:general nucleoside transport system permease protein
MQPEQGGRGGPSAGAGAGARWRFRVRRRIPSGEPLRDLGAGLLAILLALAVVAVLIALMGINPLKAYAALFQGSLGSRDGIGETLVRMTPLLLVGLGVSIAFRGGIWNIGAEGQIYMGALGATLAGLYLPRLPAAVHLPVTVLAGFLFGGLWGAIPGYMKGKLKANEIVITIMMNYLALFLVSYLVSGPMRDPNRMVAQAQTALIAEPAFLPRLMPGSRAHAGILLALLAAVLTWFLLHRTTLGYNIKAVGASPLVAAYGGVAAVSTITLAMFLSGGLAGLAGMGEVSGVHHYLLEGVSPGYGYLGIAVALLGGLEPLGVVLSAFFFGALTVGAETMQRSVGVPVAMVYFTQGLVVLFVLARRAFRARTAASTRE